MRDLGGILLQTFKSLENPSEIPLEVGFIGVGGVETPQNLDANLGPQTASIRSKCNFFATIFIERFRPFFRPNWHGQRSDSFQIRLETLLYRKINRIDAFLDIFGTLFKLFGIFQPLCEL